MPANRRINGNAGDAVDTLPDNYGEGNYRRSDEDFGLDFDEPILIRGAKEKKIITIDRIDRENLGNDKTPAKRVDLRRSITRSILAFGGRCRQWTDDGWQQ